MRKSLVTGGLAVMLAPALIGCVPEQHVQNGDTDYYDANTLAVDSMPSQPYTKNGVYYVNPEDATNTRDNRGSRVPGYGHDAQDDPGVRNTNASIGGGTYYHPASSLYPPGTVVYGDGTVVYPDGTIVPAHSTVVVAPAVIAPAQTHTTTTVISPDGSASRTTVIETAPY